MMLKPFGFNRKASSGPPSFTPSILATDGTTMQILAASTWTSSSITFPGGRVAVTLNGYASNSSYSIVYHVTGVTINGVAATQRQSCTNNGEDDGQIWDADVSAGSGTIVITYGSSAYRQQLFITAYDMGGFTYKGGVTYGDTSSVSSRDLSQNTVAGDAVIAVNAWCDGTPYGTITGLSAVSHPVVSEIGYNHWDNLSVSGGTPETFKIDTTASGIFAIASARYGA